MSYDEMIRLAKETVINRYPNEEDGKLGIIYSSGMMEMQRVLLQSMLYDKLYVVTINQLDETTSLKSYVVEA